MIILLNETMVIIGDLIDSRKIENRKEIQNKLNTILDRVNNKYRDSIIVPFKVTLGDEFVGVLKSYREIMDLLQYMDAEFDLIKIRYGIGVGEFENFRGQGYKNALKAIAIAKKNKFKAHLLTSNIIDNFSIIINLFLHLYFNILSNYNGRQKYIIYQLIKGKTQSEIADILSTSQSSISQSLNKANWRLLLKTNEVFYNLSEYAKIKKELIYTGTYMAFIAATEANNEIKLKGLFDFINQKYSSIIRSGFIPTSLSPEDDNFYEFQGLLYNKVDNFDKILYLLVELYTELGELYLGIGLGDIVTRISDRAIGMDGTAFYRAREALNVCFSDKIKVNLKLFNKPLDSIYTLILSLFIEFIQAWSYKQSLAVRFKQEGLSQNEIKGKMNLSRSTVAEHLQRASWNDYEFIINNISNLIKLDRNATL